METVYFSIFFLTWFHMSSSSRPVSLFPILPLTAEFTNNDLCNKESDEYTQNFNNFTLWANEMQDSNAKLPVGTLRGSIYNMGDFSQCLTARAPFATQYCLPTIKMRVPQTVSQRDPYSIYYSPTDFVLDKLYENMIDPSQQPRNIVKIAWCVPASCTSSVLENYLNSYLTAVDHPFKSFNISYRASVPPIMCQTSNKKPLDLLDISFCVTVCVAAFLVLYGTFYDHHIYANIKNGSYRRIIIMIFSARRNIAALAKQDRLDEHLRILNGIRTICIFMIILDHRFATFISGAVTNVDFIEEQYRNVWVSFIFRGDLFVDSFFVLSGLLVVYGIMNQLDKAYISPLMVVFMRYIRLFPVYGIVIFYYATILYHSGSGPLWEILVGIDTRDCRNNWWTNLLFISNYVNTNKMCIPISWYLSCDFHYFIIALLLCYILKKKKYLGYTIYISLLILSIAVPCVITLIYRRPAFLRFYSDFLTGPKEHIDFKLTYSKSHTRASPYIIGMFAGYLYHSLKGTDKRMKKVATYIILCASIALLGVCLYTGAIFYNPYHPYNELESGVYAALHRVLWATGSVGFLMVLSFGMPNVLATALSSNFWIPLSKLVYGAYLTHFQFQLRAAASFRNPRRLNYFDMFSYGLSDIILAFSTSLFIHLLVEAPIRSIIRELLFISKSRSESRSTTCIMESTKV